MTSNVIALTFYVV